MTPLSSTEMEIKLTLKAELRLLKNKSKSPRAHMIRKNLKKD